MTVRRIRAVNKLLRKKALSLIQRLNRLRDTIKDRRLAAADARDVRKKLDEAWQALDELEKNLIAKRGKIN